MRTDFQCGEMCRALSDRGNIRKLDHIPDLYKNNYNGECYSSVYRYRPDYTPKGYKGPVWACGLHFDLDGATAQPDTRELLERLCIDATGLYVDDLHIYFSGNKGFHIYALSTEIQELEPSAAVPQRIKAICKKLAGDLPSFDVAVYDSSRIFRVANSRHQKSKLYKIPLYATEIFNLSMDQIKRLAVQKRSLHDIKTIKGFIHGIA